MLLTNSPKSTQKESWSDMILVLAIFSLGATSNLFFGAKPASAFVHQWEIMQETRGNLHLRHDTLRHVTTRHDKPEFWHEQC
jgi:hypothetical protein